MERRNCVRGTKKAGHSKRRPSRLTPTTRSPFFESANDRKSVRPNWRKKRGKRNKLRNAITRGSRSSRVFTRKIDTRENKKNKKQEIHTHKHTLSDETTTRNLQQKNNVFSHSHCARCMFIATSYLERKPKYIILLYKITV